MVGSLMGWRPGGIEPSFSPLGRKRSPSLCGATALSGNVAQVYTRDSPYAFSKRCDNLRVAWALHFSALQFLPGSRLIEDHACDGGRDRGVWDLWEPIGN